jgi:hypothetical protein
MPALEPTLGQCQFLSLSMAWSDDAAGQFPLATDSLRLQHLSHVESEVTKKWRDALVYNRVSGIDLCVGIATLMATGWISWIHRVAAGRVVLAVHADRRLHEGSIVEELNFAMSTGW